MASFLSGWCTSFGGRLVAHFTPAAAAAAAAAGGAALLGAGGFAHRILQLLHLPPSSHNHNKQLSLNK
jgi:hypothetical protein